MNSSVDRLSQNGIGVFVIVVTSFVPNMVTDKKNENKAKTKGKKNEDENEKRDK